MAQARMEVRTTTTILEGLFILVRHCLERGGVKCELDNDVISWFISQRESFVQKVIVH